jgi:hypothetical protein
MCDFVYERRADQLLGPLVATAARGWRIVSVGVGTFVLAAGR